MLPWMVGTLAMIVTVPVTLIYSAFAHCRQKAHKDLVSGEASRAEQEVGITSANEFGNLMRCSEMRV